MRRPAARPGGDITSQGDNTMGHGAIAQDYQAGLTGLSVRPLPSALGAEVTGIDLRRLDDALTAAIRRAFLEHLLLVFPRQSLEPQDMVRLVARFGTPIASRQINPFGNPVYELGLLPPEVTAVSNIRQDGQPVGILGDGEVAWHSDHSYAERPAGARMLYGAEVPPPAAGGNTFFLNACAAYDALAPDRKQALMGRTIKHDNAVDLNMRVRAGADATQSVVDSPGPVHPIVSTHPETGHNALFLGRRSRAYVSGFSIEDSEALLNELWAHTIQPRFCYEHTWSPGDLVLWDNRCAMHRRGAFDPAARRMLYAAQVEGHRPFQAPDALHTPAHPRFAGAAAARTAEAT